MKQEALKKLLVDELPKEECDIVDLLRIHRGKAKEELKTITDFSTEMLNLIQWLLDDGYCGALYEDAAKRLLAKGKKMEL